MLTYACGKMSGSLTDLAGVTAYAYQFEAQRLTGPGGGGGGGEVLRYVN